MARVSPLASSGPSSSSSSSEGGVALSASTSSSVNSDSSELVSSCWAADLLESLDLVGGGGEGEGEDRGSEEAIDLGMLSQLRTLDRAGMRRSVS